MLRLKIHIFLSVHAVQHHTIVMIYFVITCVSRLVNRNEHVMSTKSTFIKQSILLHNNSIIYFRKSNFTFHIGFFFRFFSIAGIYCFRIECTHFAKWNIVNTERWIILLSLIWISENSVKLGYIDVILCKCFIFYTLRVTYRDTMEDH